MAEHSTRRGSTHAWAAAVVTMLAATAGTVIAYRPDRGLLEQTGSFGRDTLGITVAAISWAVTGAVLTTLKPGNTIGRLLSGVSFLLALTALLQAYGAYGAAVAEPAWPAARWVAQLSGPLWLPAFLLPYSVLLVLYPTGRAPSGRWRAAAWSAGAGVCLLMVAYAFDPTAYDDLIADADAPVRAPAALVSSLYPAGFLLLAAASIAIWIGTAVRLVRSRPPQRQQLAWLVAVLVPFGATMFFLDNRIISNAVGVLVPVAVAVGVLRYRLLGIDLVLRRWLVYGTLTLAVTAAYLGTTTLAGSALGHGPLPGLVAAALVAVGLTPLRDHLQRAVDRFVYGDRRDPMRALARVGDRMATGADTSGDLLTSVLTATAEAVRAPGAELLGTDGVLLARSGSDLSRGTDATIIPLRLSGAAVGTLKIADRTDGESYASPDLKVLHALAPSVAAAVRADALAHELAVERDRVIDATRAERDRYRSDLHDGLGPALTGIALALQVAAESLNTGDSTTVHRMVEAARAEADASATEVHRIIQDLRPSSLDRLDLIDAIHERAKTFAPDIAVRVTAPTVPPRLPPDVETTAYRIVCEALTNVVRHAAATEVLVEVERQGTDIMLRVTDNGQGLPRTPGKGLHPRGTGVGLGSMSARAARHGGTLVVDSPGSLGGTVVTARFPLQERS